MVFEFLEKNLLEVLDDTPDGLPANAVRCYIFQLLKAIAFCHHRSIIHRDIKPENLLISRSCDPLQNALVRRQGNIAARRPIPLVPASSHPHPPPALAETLPPPLPRRVETLPSPPQPALGAGILKLCDFGFARQLQGQPADLTDYVSTRWYRAPELLVGMPYSFPVDVWAVGCIMGELTDGQPLFPGESDIDQLYVIQRVAGAVPQAMAQAFAANPRYKGLTMPAPSQEGNLADRYATLMPPEGRDLLAKLLAMDPAERPTGQEALQHPYFAPIHAASAIHSGVPSGKSAALEALKAGAFHGRDARHRDHGHGHGKGKGKRARSKDLAQDSVTTQAVAACGAGRDAGEVTSSARRAAEDAASDAGGAAAAAGREERSERGERTEEVTPRESVAGAAAAVLASQGLYSHGSSGVVSRPISVEARRGMHLGGKGGGGNPLVRQAGQQRSGAGAGGGKTRKRDKVSPPVSSGRLQPGQKRQMAMEVAPTEPGPSQASSHAAPALGPLPDSVRGWGQGREEDGVGGGLRGAGGKGKGVEGAQGSGSGHGMAHLPGWRGGGAEGDGGAGPGPGSDVRIGMSGWGSRGERGAHSFA